MKKLFFVILFILCLPVIIVLVGAPFNWPTPAPQNYSQSTLQDNHHSLKEALELRILTYNIANAHGFTTNHKERIQAVVDMLVKLDVDIAGLQEVFIEEDRNFLIQQLQKTPLKYHAQFPAGFLGNGLVIVSKYPIEEHWFHRFKANNPWWKVWEGDWWAGKGIGLARIKVAEQQFIDFYNVHAQAYRGNQASHDVRYLQYQEAANFLNNASLKHAPAFFVGDFNTEQSFPDYKLVEEQANLLRLMTIDSEIDHITAIDKASYEFEVLDTQEIFQEIKAPNPGKFYSRAPTPAEFYEMHFTNLPDTFTTQVSDHPGYLSTIKIIPSQPPVAEVNCC